MNPATIAASLSSDRARVVRALEYLEEQGCLELRASDARLRFRRLVGPERRAPLGAELVARFSRRERQAIAQVADVVRVVTAEECQTNLLVAHFGDRREAPCGHCSFCLRGSGAGPLDPGAPEAVRGMPAVFAEVDAGVVRELVANHPRALGAPRKLARFLSGLSSPAVVAAKLTRHALYGALEGRRFYDVLAFSEEQLAGAGGPTGESCG